MSRDVCGHCGGEIDIRGRCYCPTTQFDDFARRFGDAPEDDRIKAAGNNPKDAAGGKKVPLALLSPIAKAHWAAAQFCGAEKYGRWNWRIAGVRTSVYLSAAQRHLDAYMSGERYDPVDGTHHLGNAMACMAILLDAEAAGKMIDDRPPSVSLRPSYDEVQDTMAKLREQYAGVAPRHYTIEDTEECPSRSRW